MESIEPHVTCLHDEVSPGETSIAMLSLEAPASRTHRNTVQVLLVVDISYSMCEPAAKECSFTRLDLVKKSINYIVRILSPEDHLAIATFSNSGSLALSMTSMTDAGKAQAEHIVENMQVDAATNVEAGLAAGCQALANGNTPTDGMKVIILLSDGEVNRGKEGQSLVSFTKDLVRSKGEDTRLFTFGLGEGDDAQLLQELALAGRGTYTHLIKEDDCPSAFACVVGTMATLAAKELEVKFSGKNGAKISKTEHDSQVWEPAGSNGFRVKLADIAGGENRHLLVQFKVPNDAPKDTTLEVVCFQGKYRNMSGDEIEFTVSGRILISTRSKKSKATNFQVECELVRLRSADAVEKAFRSRRQSESDGFLTDAIKYLNAHCFNSTPFFISIQKDLSMIQESLRRAQSIGQRRAYMLGQELRGERQVRPGLQGLGMFATKIQKELAKESVRYVLPHSMISRTAGGGPRYVVNPLQSLRRVVAPSFKLADPYARSSNVADNGPKFRVSNLSTLGKNEQSEPKFKIAPGSSGGGSYAVPMRISNPPPSAPPLIPSTGYNFEAAAKRCHTPSQQHTPSSSAIKSPYDFAANVGSSPRASSNSQPGPTNDVNKYDFGNVAKSSSALLPNASAQQQQHVTSSPSSSLKYDFGVVAKASIESTPSAPLPSPVPASEPAPTNHLKYDFGNLTRSSGGSSPSAASSHSPISPSPPVPASEPAPTNHLKYDFGNLTRSSGGSSPNAASSHSPISPSPPNPATKYDFGNVVGTSNESPESDQAQDSETVEQEVPKPKNPLLARLEASEDENKPKNSPSASLSYYNFASLAK